MLHSGKVLATVFTYRAGVARDAGFEDSVCDCDQPAGDSDDDQLVWFPAYFEGLEPACEVVSIASVTPSPVPVAASL